MSIYRGRTKNDVYLASLLYDSIEDQDFESIKVLLAIKGADPNLVLPKQKIAPFHLIIGNDSDEFALRVTELILLYGGDPNVRSDEGLTPIHIAAAWGRIDILKLLLNCGGDPQIRDIANNSPLYYAYEERYLDCAKLLKDYLPESPFNREKDDAKYYDLTLDKILVNNNRTIGEYEIINEYKTDSIQNKFEVLKELPQSNSNDYIIDWFNKNLINSSRRVNKSSSCEIITETESSPDESDNDGANTSSPRNKKILKKTTTITTTPKNIENLTVNSCKAFSDESGVLAFSQFSINGKPPYFPYPKLEFSPKKLSFLSNEKKKNEKQDTSSDYITCSSGTTNSLTNNIFEMNIFDINNECNDEIKSQTTKSEGICSDLSFVSLSEVYKYVDKEEGVVLYEQRFLKSHPISEGSEKSSLASLPKTFDYDSESLRKELTTLGYNPGPITVTTKRVYLKKLLQLKRNPLNNPINNIPPKRVYSLELEKTLKNPEWHKDLSCYKTLEDTIVKQFNNPDPRRRWREGVNKSSFTYLLLDPRISNNLPFRAETLSIQQVWEIFLSSIFYVGKGKRSRPYQHLYEAVNLWNNKIISDNKKLNKILDIWKDGSGVICLHVFQNIIPVEAYTREAAMIAALNINNVCNIKIGDFYGSAVAWPQKDKKMLGVYLLYKAMRIFLNEGERQIRPNDID